MNEKQAREIIELHKHLMPLINDPISDQTKVMIMVARNQGYLEAIEKAKVLVECLDHAYIILDNHENHVYKEEMNKLMEMIQKVLAQWEKEK